MTYNEWETNMEMLIGATIAVGIFLVCFIGKLIW